MDTNRLLELIRETADAIAPCLECSPGLVRLYTLGAALGNAEMALVLDVDLTPEAKVKARRGLCLQDYDRADAAVRVNLEVIRRRWRDQIAEMEEAP